jgi:anti-sigma regulatory factor (Ser/Thr protein kinase)
MGTVERFSATVQPRDDAAPAILAALEATERFAMRAALAPAVAARLSIVVEELVSNALRHGGDGRAITVELSLTESDGQVRLDLADDGAAFDPTAERRFDGPDRESGGGVGLALIRAWAGEIAYARERGLNRVRVILRCAERGEFEG